MAQQRILVYRIGNLGDSLIALPALWFVREYYRGAHVTLLCNRSSNRRELAASDVFRDTRLFDDVLHYGGPLADLPLGGKALDYARLLAAIRRGRFDKLVYLPPSRRTAAEIARDKKFFRLAGIRDLVGFDDVPAATSVTSSAKPLATQPREAQSLLDRLTASGLPVPPLEACRIDLEVQPSVRRSFGNWVARQTNDGGRPWIALGIGTKMPAKQWPADRFARVVAKLIEEFDVWPMIFGGSEDRAQAEALLAAWGRGAAAAGELTLGEASVALEHCDLYLGNDTGTMHMAAAAGVRCVAIFSARDWPGKWYPCGSGHVILRKSVSCEGCLLVECVEHANQCLTQISVDEAYQACRRALQEGRHQRRDHGGSLPPSNRRHTAHASVRG